MRVGDHHTALFWWSTVDPGEEGGVRDLLLINFYP
jgi:hypothetical protein